MFVFVGTYTRGGESEGIYTLDFDPRNGALTLLGVTEGVDNPSFLAIHPRGDLLYAVEETADFEGEKSGAVSAFRVDRKTGGLELLNRVSSLGAHPCHIVVDRGGRTALVANYSGGNATAIRIEDSGHLGSVLTHVQHTGASRANPKRQEAPHAHSINLDPTEAFAVVADLGLDAIRLYRFDPVKGLDAHSFPEAKVAPGGGPRHFAFHPTGRHAYTNNELNSTVTAFTWDASAGTLKEVQTISTLPDELSGSNSTAEIQVHPGGRFLYVSNRGHDSIAVFSIAAESGKLTRIENESTVGDTPRNFGIDPTGRYLLAANQGTGTIVVFRIDEATGALEPTGQSIRIPRPVCVRFLGR